LPESEKDEIRRGIVEDIESSLGSRHHGELLLVIGLILATFGSAAALMPDSESVTGNFAGTLQVQEPAIESTDIRLIDKEGNHLTFVVDQEVVNPNIVDMEVETIAFRVDAGSETVKRYSIDGDTVIESESSEMIASKVSIDMSKLVSGERSFEETTDDMKVEGAIRFSSAGEIFDRTFLKRFSVS
jgi:LEA14-like dessication related protein